MYLFISEIIMIASFVPFQDDSLLSIVTHITLPGILKKSRKTPISQIESLVSGKIFFNHPDTVILKIFANI
jgi:hypothetical protein